MSSTSGPRSQAVIETIRKQLRRNLDVEHPNLGDVVDNRYEVLKKLGEGGFGIVFEVKNLESGAIYAMKIELEKPLEDEIGMKLEATVLKRGQGLAHFLRYIDEGSHGAFCYFVMQRAGPSLSRLQKMCHRRRFSNDTTTRLAVQCLEAVRNVHSIGFLHRDIKPANFLLGAHGTSDASTVYILDFGLVRRYKLKNGSHRPERQWGGFRGGIRCKRATRKEKLLERMEPEYTFIYDHIASMHYADEPHYAFLREQLAKIWRRKNYSYRTPFDWELSDEIAQHRHKYLWNDVRNIDKSTMHTMGNAGIIYGCSH